MQKNEIQKSSLDASNTDPDATELMSDVIRELYGYGQRLIGACPVISNHYRSGEHGTANELLIQFVEGMNWLSKALQLTKPFQEEHGIQIEMELLPEKLNALVGALENQDFSLLGDVLEHEIQPLLENWWKQLEPFDPNRIVTEGQ